MHPMIEKEQKGLGKIKGRLADWNRKRIEEKNRIRKKEEAYKKQLEGKYIRMRVEKKLRMKYTHPTFGWSVPKSGERSAGMGILEGLSGTVASGKKKKKPATLFM